MNIEKLLQLSRDAHRLSRADKQLNLGQLIELIESIGTKTSKGEDKYVCYDFGTAIPTTLSSWRGSYDELELNYTLTGYDNRDNHFEQATAENLLNHLKFAIGKEFTGWKGGEFIMNESTPLWASNEGNASNSAIVGVIDEGWRIIIETKYLEY